jgi:hypothetical protein
MPDMGNEPDSADRGQLPVIGAKGATVAQVVAIAAGVLAMAGAVLMWRVLGYTAANLSTGVSFEPSSITNGSVLLSEAPGGAGALVAVVALALRGRARWLRYLQIGLGFLALAGFVYIAGTCAPLIGLWPLYGPLAVGEISAVAAIVLLTRSLHRPAGRQPRWHLALVLLAAAVPCIAIATDGGPTGSGILTGIVSRCPQSPDHSPVMTVTVQNQAGQTVASQRLPFTTSGARDRMRLPTGTYSIDAAAGGASAGDTVYVPANQTDEEDFDDPSIATCVG